MTIYVGSRYEDSPVDRIPVGDTFESALYPERKPLLQVFSFSTYVVQMGDRTDSIAAQVLGDPELNWVIANANPELLYPDDLPVGTVLRIPDRYVR